MSSLSFTKLFSSITDSSVWQESDETRLVWITMLSMADPLGRIHAAVPGLSHRARVSLEATQKALDVFLSPDPYSRSEDHDGRRIEKIQGGWRLLNYAIYRELRDDEARKEQNRLAQQRKRKGVSKYVSNSADCQQVSAESMTVSNVSNSQPPSAQEEVEEEEDKNITPAMVSNSVISELGLSGRELSVAMDQICTSEMSKGRTATDLRDALILAWRDYDASRPNLTQYVKRPINFFGDGDWRSKSKWPWKDGKQPASGRVYVNV